MHLNKLEMIIENGQRESEQQDHGWAEDKEEFLA
jgi:hypothetical protein